MQEYRNIGIWSGPSGSRLVLLFDKQRLYKWFLQLQLLSFLSIQYLDANRNKDIITCKTKTKKTHSYWRCKGQGNINKENEPQFITQVKQKSSPKFISSCLHLMSQLIFLCFIKVKYTAVAAGFNVKANQESTLRQEKC